MNNFYLRLVRKIYSVLESVKFKRTPLSANKGTLLLLRLDSIGDYVLFRNFIQVLKASEKYKGYKITLCGNLWWKELAENLDKDYVDEYIWIDYHKMQDFKYRFRKYNEIYSGKYEVLIHPTFSRDAVSDNVVVHSGAKEKIGYDGDMINLTPLQKNENNLAYTRLIPSLSEFKFEFYRNKDFFEQLLSEKIAVLKPQINYTSTVENKIIICPGAKDAFRRWSTENFRHLCALLKRDYLNEEFVICGSKEDGILAKEIAQNSNISFSDLTGKLSLIELVRVMAEAKLVITNDSGPFHVAVALGKKVICISNGNNYGRFTPYPKEMNTNSSVIYPDQILAESEEERLKKFCKEVKDVNINEIKVEHVFSEIKKHMSKCDE